MTQRRYSPDDNAARQAEREERTKALLQQLEAGVQAIQTGDDFRRYLRIAAKFHSYRALI